MAAADERARWVLLMPTVPPTPAYARVKIWRRLQATGAIGLKNSVWVLPSRDECVGTFLWVARAIHEMGGQASLCEGQFIDGMTDAEIERRFNDARSADYVTVGQEARDLAKTLRAKKLGADRLAAIAGQIEKLRKRFGEVVAIDFFHASGRESAEGLIDGIVHLLKERRGDRPADDSLERVPRPVGATWVTRTGVHVDRIASAWLIRRFVDPEGTLKFVPATGYVPKKGEIRFDMYEAEFTHVGDRCSFEVIVERMGLEDRALVAIGEIVHDIDLRDGKFGREETAGFRSTITGICSAIREDEGRIAAATPMIDALYTYFARARKAGGK